MTGKDNPDAKSSLVGRLMQRKMVHDFQNIDYKDIKLLRTTKGKPYFVCRALREKVAKLKVAKLKVAKIESFFAHSFSVMYSFVLGTIEM